MSDLSRAILHGAIDYSGVSLRRIENYKTLAGRLGNLALYPELPSGTVPLGFPVRVENRDEMRSALFAERIFPPIHWPLDSIVPAHFHESHRLSATIMTLPCDQRYAESDMERMAAIIEKELAN